MKKHAIFDGVPLFDDTHKNVVKTNCAPSIDSLQKIMLATAAGVFRDVMITTLPEAPLEFQGVLQGRGAFCTITSTTLPAAE